MVTIFQRAVVGAVPAGKAAPAPDKGPGHGIGAGDLVDRGDSVLQGGWPITIPNAVCLLLSGFTLLLILLPHRPTQAVAETLDRNRDCVWRALQNGTRALPPR